MKALCCKCRTLAVWKYMPWSATRVDRFYCEEHIHRGCSCNILHDGTEPLDEKGRQFPCCEYDYSEKGFQVEL